MASSSVAPIPAGIGAPCVPALLGVRRRDTTRLPGETTRCVVDPRPDVGPPPAEALVRGRSPGLLHCRRPRSAGARLVVRGRLAVREHERRDRAVLEPDPRRGPATLDRPPRRQGLRFAEDGCRAPPRSRARPPAHRALHAPRPPAEPLGARCRPRARRPPGSPRAAPAHPRGVGLPTAHALRRPAGADPPSRDRDPRRALPRPAPRPPGSRRARRRCRLGRDRPRSRRRASRGTRRRARRLGGRARAGPGERGAHGDSTSSCSTPI